MSNNPAARESALMEESNRSNNKLRTLLSEIRHLVDTCTNPTADVSPRPNVSSAIGGRR